MRKPNLGSALAKALAGSPPTREAAAALPPSPPDKVDVLLAALRNSATGCDQIMQRRIGMEHKDS
jgi:hypothetical protein